MDEFQTIKEHMDKMAAKIPPFCIQNGGNSLLRAVNNEGRNDPNRRLVASYQRQGYS